MAASSLPPADSVEALIGTPLGVSNDVEGCTEARAMLLRCLLLATSAKNGCEGAKADSKLFFALCSSPTARAVLLPAFVASLCAAGKLPPSEDVGSCLVPPLVEKAFPEWLPKQLKSIQTEKSRFQAVLRDCAPDALQLFTEDQCHFWKRASRHNRWKSSQRSGAPASDSWDDPDDEVNDSGAPLSASDAVQAVKQLFQRALDSSDDRAGARRSALRISLASVDGVSLTVPGEPSVLVSTTPPRVFSVPQTIWDLALLFLAEHGEQIISDLDSKRQWRPHYDLLVGCVLTFRPFRQEAAGSRSALHKGLYNTPRGKHRRPPKRGREEDSSSDGFSPGSIVPTADQAWITRSLEESGRQLAVAQQASQVLHATKSAGHLTLVRAKAQELLLAILFFHSTRRAFILRTLAAQYTTLGTADDLLLMFSVYAGELIPDVMLRVCVSACYHELLHPDDGEISFEPISSDDKRLDQAKVPESFRS
jgi:hypothetical protein